MGCQAMCIVVLRPANIAERNILTNHEENSMVSSPVQFKTTCVGFEIMAVGTFELVRKCKLVDGILMKSCLVSQPGFFASEAGEAEFAVVHPEPSKVAKAIVRVWTTEPVIQSTRLWNPW